MAEEAERVERGDEIEQRRSFCTVLESLVEVIRQQSKVNIAILGCNDLIVRVRYDRHPPGSNACSMDMIDGEVVAVVVVRCTMTNSTGLLGIFGRWVGKQVN